MKYYKIEITSLPRTYVIGVKPDGSGNVLWTNGPWTNGPWNNSGLIIDIPKRQPLNADDVNQLLDPMNEKGKTSTEITKEDLFMLAL